MALVRAYIYELEQADGCYPHGVRTMSGRSSRLRRGYGGRSSKEQHVYFAIDMGLMQ